jgi:glutaredoxin-dependent peroxiredoxin
MALAVGQPAPHFTLKSKQASGVVDVKLSDYHGKNVVILFFPLAFTGVCTKEMCSVSDGLELYDSLNAQVLGISVDSPFTLEVFGQQNNLKIPLLSDFNRDAAKAYGAYYDVFVPGGLDMNGVAKRSAFVVDKEGVVRYAEVLESAGDLPNFDNIAATLKSLN